MLQRLYELVTGRPWTTVRSAAAEFGPPPGARYAAELSRFSDAELYGHGDRIVAQLAVQREWPPLSRVAQARGRTG
jgi:hypothetical protein